MQAQKHLACMRVHPPTSRRKTLWLDDVVLASAERPPGTRRHELELDVGALIALAVVNGGSLESMDQRLRRRAASGH